MSSRRETRSLPPSAGSTVGSTTTDHAGGFSSPTPGETATILSVPAVLLAVHFLVQPLVDSWGRFGYVRYEAARAASPARIAPEPLTGYAWWWHELTRLTHALVHDPSGYHAHVVGNVVILAGAAWALLALLSALGRRRWFPFVYWELVVVAPLVGSYAFDLWGQTPHGYGASTIGYAFLGVVLVTGLFVLREHLPGAGRQAPTGSPLRPHFVAGLLAVVACVVLVDLLSGSPATPVHQAGVGFGALVGSVVVHVDR